MGFFRISGAQPKLSFTRVTGPSAAGENVVYISVEPTTGWQTTAEIKAQNPSLAKLTDAQVDALKIQNTFSLDNRAKLTAVGLVQYSADGATWVDAIPAGTLKAGQPVDFYIRPKTTTPADDGTYQYNFLMATVGAGGLSLVNGSGTARNTAHIFGTTPLDQVGQLFSVNVSVIDAFTTSINGTALTQTWS